MMQFNVLDIFNIIDCPKTHNINTTATVFLITYSNLHLKNLSDIILSLPIRMMEYNITGRIHII